MKNANHLLHELVSKVSPELPSIIEVYAADDVSSMAAARTNKRERQRMHRTIEAFRDYGVAWLSATHSTGFEAACSLSLALTLR